MLSRQYRAFNSALESLYNDCEPATFANSGVEPLDFDDSKFTAMAERIFREKGFNVSQLSTPEGKALINETFGVLRNAIASSITQEVPEILTYALENNAFVFSGFKTFHSMREVGLSLTNPDGSIKPFERFLNDVQTINDRYNHNYLRAEYNQAVAASQMAVRWHEFEQDGDDYYLQYRTAGDSHVREEHAVLHNTTLPVSDPFWDSFLPPNGWNCRCTTVKVRKSKYPMSDPELAMRRGQNCTDGAKRQIFRFNPGKSMRLFPERHPYMPKGCGDCDKRLNLTFSPNSEKCKACEEINRQKRIALNRQKYEELKKDPNYKDVEFNPVTGALKATHVGHKEHPNDKVRHFEEGLTGDDLEDEFMNLAFNSEHSVIFNNESKVGKNGNQLSSLDMTFDGVVMDIKSITKLKDFYGNAIKAKNEQLLRYNIREDVKIKSDTICLYFHDSSMYSPERIIEGVEWVKQNPLTTEIAVKTIICALKDGNGLKIIRHNV